MFSDQSDPFAGLLAEDSRLKTFIDTVPAGILVIGLDDGRVILSNRFLNEDLGLGEEHLLGANWESFFVDPDERQRLMVEFSVEDEVRDFELRLRGPGGKTIWGLASLSWIPIEEEDLLLFAFSDISRIKKAELELAQRNDELSELNQVKNQFLGMAAHDLRNPISAIRGMSELINRLDVNEAKKRNLIGNIVDISGQMLDLLNDLLDVSAIEDGSFELQREAHDLAELMKSRVGMVAFAADAKNIEIVLDLETLPPVLVDRPRIGQALDNLLTNAVKFSPPNSIVEASVRRVKDTVELIVADHGQGIPADEVDKVFTPFEKLSSKPTAGEKSTGLGLAIARQVVDAHDGKITVSSELGAGATFTIALPFVEQIDAGGDIRPVSHEAGSDAQPTAQGLTVLIAEDDKINQTLFSAVVTQFGYTVMLANDGREALELLQENDIDVILMDVQMPRLKGTDAARLIRQMKGPKADVPIIALSANASDDHKKAYIEAGMNDTVPKPIDSTELVRVLDRVLT